MVEALSLLLTGMFTIFIILSAVVILGNLLIRLVNRFAPDSAPVNPTAQSIDGKKLAAIVSAVEIVTMGEGRIVEVRPGRD